MNPPRAQIAFEDVRSLTPPPSALAGEIEEITLRWETPAGSPAVSPSGPEARDALTVLGRRGIEGPIAVERDPQISPYHIVSIASDASGNPVSWQILPDPRVIRAELPRPDGTLEGRTLQRTSAEFPVIVPAAGAARVDIYAPQWDGRQWMLSRIAGAALAGEAGR